MALALGWAFGAPAGAQQPASDSAAAARPARADTVAPRDTLARRDTLAPRDTLARGDTLLRRDTLVRRDTIKAPLPVYPTPPAAAPGPPFRWDREAIFASGALTLTELLDQVPGATTFRTGLIASPQRAAYLGNPARVRVFYDGVELDPLADGSGGALALETVPLWTLEEVAVERGADEVRVYLRSWRVRRTTPSSRVDVLTGDAGTNLFRGYFGKRFGGGEVLQLGGQQYGTSNDERLGSGNELSLVARTGIARARWSVDALALRSSGTRDPQQRLALGGAGIPQLTARRTFAYLRVGAGSPGAGAWAQVIGSLQHLSPDVAADATAPPDAESPVRSLAEYVAAAGYDRGPLRLGITNRLRVREGETRNGIAARAAVTVPRGAVAARVEWAGRDSTTLAEASLRVNPLPWIEIGGAVARRQGGALEGPALAMRGEAGLAFRGRYVGGGVLRLPATVVGALPVYDSSYAPASAPALTGIFATARGRIWRDLGANVWAVQWPDAGPYRPRRQARTELYLDTRWLRRFPSGNFGLLAAVAEEYRSPTLFPFVGPEGEPGVQLANYSNLLITRVEIRLLSAVLFFRQRFVIGPPNAELVPGYIQLRQYNTYGVRWEFWN